KYPSVEPSKACVANGQMQFYPDRWAKVYDHWLTNIQDWCISRQLWWGHQIPVWSGKVDIMSLGLNLREGVMNLRAACAERETLEDGSEIIWQIRPPVDGKSDVSAATYSNAGALRLQELGLTQDPDVLDTWFSSWLWPFATMGWPEKTETLKK